MTYWRKKNSQMEFSTVLLDPITSEKKSPWTWWLQQCDFQPLLWGRGPCGLMGFWGSKESQFPHFTIFFRLLDPWSHGPFLHLKASDFISLSPWLSFLPPSSTFKDPCDYIRPTLVIYNKLSILMSVSWSSWFHLPPRFLFAKTLDLFASPGKYGQGEILQEHHSAYHSN